jgi:hypothetical protein
MSRIAVALLIIFLVFMDSCAIPQSQFSSQGKVILSPKGEKIQATTEDQKKWEGEFLFCDEQCVYILAEEKAKLILGVKSIPIETIVHFKVDLSVNRSWIGFVFGFQLIPAVVLGITYGAFANDMNGGLALAGAGSIPGALSLLFFSLGQPSKPELKGKINYSELKELQKYARYPFTPNPEQKQKILENLDKSSERKSSFRLF